MKFTLEGKSFEVLNITGSATVGEMRLNFNGEKQTATVEFKDIHEYLKFKTSMQVMLEGSNFNPFMTILNRVQEVLEKSDLPKEKKDELIKQIAKF